MFFTRTHRYLSSLPKEEIKSRLIGNHFKIHQLDFEIFENGPSLSIIPDDDEVKGLKTLPFTEVEFKDEGSKTRVSVTFKMRKIDSGGPFLIVLFCSFLLLASITMMYVDPKEQTIIYTLFGIAIFSITMFTYRMQTGYFDYVRKIRNYIRSKVEPATANMSAPAMA